MNSEPVTNVREAVRAILDLGYSADELIGQGSEANIVMEAVDLIERFPYAASVRDIPDHLL